MTNMRRCSVAHAKAHLPELITDAERDGRETVIERRGRPVARIAPLAARELPRKDAIAEFDAAVDELRKVRWHKASATSALRDARGRLE
jgi:prevent-host-death family protein